MDPIELDAGLFRLRPWRADDVDAVLEALLEPETGLERRQGRRRRRRGGWSGAAGVGRA